MNSNRQLAPGTTLNGRYVIREELGHGGNASVHRARDERLDVDVALKVMWPQLAFDQTFVERFRREGRMLATLSHQHILRLYEIGEDQDQHFYYLVLEYMSGGSVRDRLGGAPWTLDATVDLLQPIAAALDYAHSRTPPVVHRDMKPSNILFNAEGRPVISDFGVARLLSGENGDASLTADHLIGTPAYMAPEQARGEVGPAVDRYALGVVAYELLVGRVPFQSDQVLTTLMQVMQEPPPPPTDLNPNVPPAVSEVLLRQLSKQPDDRYSTCVALIGALAAAGSYVPGGAYLPGVAFDAAVSGPTRIQTPSGTPPPIARKVIAPSNDPTIAAGRPVLPGTNLHETYASPVPPVAPVPAPRKPGFSRTILVAAVMPLMAVAILGGYVMVNQAPAAPAASATPTLAPSFQPVVATTVPPSATNTSVPATSTPVPTPAPDFAVEWNDALAKLVNPALQSGDRSRAIAAIDFFLLSHPTYTPAITRVVNERLSYARELIAAHRVEAAALAVSQIQQAVTRRSAPAVVNAPAPTPSVDAVWTQMLQEIEPLWGDDWEGATLLLDAFLASPTNKDFAPAREKQYSALLEYAQKKIDEGDKDGADELFARAGLLFPDREGQIQEAAAALTPTAVPTQRSVVQPVPKPQTGGGTAPKPAAPAQQQPPPQPAVPPTKVPFSGG